MQLSAAYSGPTLSQALQAMAQAHADDADGEDPPLPLDQLREPTLINEAAWSQCEAFPGIGPEAESNHVTLRIKSGKIPKKTGISPDPAAESKVGYIPLSGRILSLDP